MRKTTTTLTTLVAAGALTALGLSLAPTAMAASPTAGGLTTSVTADGSGAEQRGHEGHGPRGGHHRGLEAIMEVLDLTEDELKAAREAGTTLAELAEQQGVSVDDLIDALVADAEEHLDERVAAGRLAQDEADERLAAIEQRITDRVNGVTPAEGERPQGERPERGERGPGGHGPNGPAGGETDRESDDS